MLRIMESAERKQWNIPQFLQDFMGYGKDKMTCGLSVFMK